MFERYFLRRKIGKYFDALPDEWRDQLTLKTSTDLILLLRSHLFKNYTIDLGKRIPFESGFLNADNAVRRLRRVSEIVRQYEVIDDDIIAAYKNPVKHDLDSFLVTDEGESVDIVVFFEVTRSCLIDTISLLSRVEYNKPELVGYYRRSLGGVARDIYSVMEALLTAALVENEQRT